MPEKLTHYELEDASAETLRVDKRVVILKSCKFDRVVFETSKQGFLCLKGQSQVKEVVNGITYTQDADLQTLLAKINSELL